MSFKELDIFSATEAEYIEAIIHNCTESRSLAKSIEQLRIFAEESQKNSRHQPYVKPAAEIICEEAQKVDEDFEEEVAYYCSLIKNISLDNIEDMESYLPLRENNQYKRILLRIQLEIIKNIKDILDFLQVEKISLYEYKDLADELSLEKEKIRILNMYLMPVAEDEKKTEERHENKLIFIPSPTGEIRLFGEIEEHANNQETYQSFYQLFQSIKDGSFKGVKCFTNNAKLKGLCEVKAGSTRVLFANLSGNKYVIIDAFVKRGTHEDGYRQRLEARYTEFMREKDTILGLLDDEEFLSMNEDYESRLFEILSPLSKPKQLKKNSDGDQQC